MSYKSLKPSEFLEGSFNLIGNEWMLITSGDIKNFNTMTANWGGLGVLWHRNVCYIFVKPQRYTYSFIEKNDYFTLTFFSKEFRKALEFCGTKSGRDFDKPKETNLTPVQGDFGTVYFDEARIVITAKKIYFQDLNPKNFMDNSINENYKNEDYHRMYIGEILNIEVKE